MARRFRRSVRRTRRSRRRTGRRLRGVSYAGMRGAYPTLPAIGLKRKGRRLPVGRKRRGGSLARVTKRRKVGDTAGYTQWQSFKYNRKLGKLTIRKQLKALSEYYDVIWRRLGRLNGQGSLYMSNYYENANNVFRPIYMIDLTSTIVGNVSAGTSTVPYKRGTPVYNLKRTLDAAYPAYAWVPVAGAAADGVTLETEWQMLHGGSANAGVPMRAVKTRGILKWSELRLNLWGCKNNPCEYQLTLCQIDERVLPAWANEPDYNGLLSEHVQFWDELSQKLIFNPNVRKPQIGYGSNMIKVIDRKTFTINPTATYETDTDPHCKTVRLFYRFNRLCNFEWTTSIDTDIKVATDPAESVKFTTQTMGGQQTTVHPKARMFFMITCAEWSGPKATYNDMTSANTPSLDIQVTSRWVDT